MDCADCDIRYKRLVSYNVNLQYGSSTVSHKTILLCHFPLVYDIFTYPSNIIYDMLYFCPLLTNNIT